jgi:hypothetical protein
VTRAHACEALRAAAGVGEFFAVDIDPADSWSPLRALLTDEATLDERVLRTRHSLATSSGVGVEVVPLRTAASVDQLALSARVLSPALGACVLAGCVPGFDPDNLRYGGQRIGVADPAGRNVAADQAAEALRTDVVETVLVPLVAAYAARFHLSTQVLWGNVASALNGAVAVLDASGTEQRLTAAPIVADLLRTPPLTGTVHSADPHFVRNSCCLWYRIPGAQLCGDCVLSA